MLSDNEVLYRYRGAHRFIPWDALVAMVIRSAGLRGTEDQERSMDMFGVWCLMPAHRRHARAHAADDS